MVDKQTKPKPKAYTHTISKNGVTVFVGKESVFSNLHQMPVVIDGYRYTCNEQYYTYSMAKLFSNDSIAQKALETTDPYKLVELHKRMPNYNHRKWLHEGQRTLYMANMAKYSQNSKARIALLRHNW